ncbi:hypothetical protein ACQ4M3_13310 [Leptolyngbya sp. AN03gr2]|uniref:hypothetical protein n=1 Tax=unclassified Leptolyngbya TaxID=2650499 RepID=UPI003D319A6A
MVQSRGIRQTQVRSWLTVGGPLAVGVAFSPVARLAYNQSFQVLPTDSDARNGSQSASVTNSADFEIVNENPHRSSDQVSVPSDPASDVDSSKADAISPDIDQLFQKAQILRQGSWFRGAYGLLQQVPQNHPRYAEAQRLMKDCASQILDRANDKYLQGDIATAVQYLEAIPEGTQAASVAKANLPTWKRQAAVLSSASQMMQREQWEDAVSTLQRFQDVPFYPSPKIQHQLNLAHEKMTHSVDHSNSM